MDKESQTQNLLQRVPIIRDWGIMKIISLSEHFKKMSFEPGQVIFDIGDLSDTLYFIQSGQVEMQVFFMVSTTHTYPVTQSEVNRTTTNLVIKRVIRRIGHGRQFGFEEMMLRKRERLFRAQVIGKARVELLYIEKKHFLQKLSDSDIIRYKNLCEKYVNFKQES